MPNYRSLVPGGYFSSNPTDTSLPVSIRMNNPGAINGASWEKTYPGYVTAVVTTPGNASTVFEAPEYGVGAWWNVLNNYRAKNITTVGGIITAYGGGQDYSAYLQFVLKQTGFSSDTVIDLGDDQKLLQLGLAQFRYEAGKTPPWSNDQILFGIRGGRAFANTGTWPISPPVGATTTTPVAGTSTTPGPVASGQISDSDLLALLQKLIGALAANAGAPQAAAQSSGTVLTTPASTNQAQTSAPPILSSIDKLIGGQGMVGYKTMFGVLGYVLVRILEATGPIAVTAGQVSPTGQILTVLTLALTALGGLAKVDRMTQALGTIATNTK
jgi:hypothetical protein